MSFCYEHLHPPSATARILHFLTLVISASPCPYSHPCPFLHLQGLLLIFSCEMTIGAPMGRFQNASHEYGQASGENAPVHLERTPLSTGKGIPTLFPKSILGNERLSTFICLVTEAVISLYRFLIFCNLQICKK